MTSTNHGPLAAGQPVREATPALHLGPLRQPNHGDQREIGGPSVSVDPITLEFEKLNARLDILTRRPGTHNEGHDSEFEEADPDWEDYRRSDHRDRYFDDRYKTLGRGRGRNQRGGRGDRFGEGGYQGRGGRPPRYADREPRQICRRDNWDPPMYRQDAWGEEDRYDERYVGVGFNDEDYKVVQTAVVCRTRPSPSESVFEKGKFLEGEARIGDERVILSFDMTNEVFQTIAISGGVLELFPDRPLILAMLDEFSFLVFVLDNGTAKVFESRVEGSELIWNHESTYCGIMPIWWSDDCVVFKNCDCGGLKKCDCVVLSDDCVDFKNCDCVVLGFPGKDDVALYNYRARKFIGRLKVPAYPNIIEPANSNIELIEYQGSLVSP
ncbi:hypothetical protein SASPL_147893 [Salvia splendens]|uniref:Uncharacterized protein n=1 Tax=Salvia splendens TaxID=180675 RepID=A0A8X8WFY7_SALSN|nr:hypothetical protein SASPL_147893 [Salvia splendens]